MAEPGDEREPRVGVLEGAVEWRRVATGDHGAADMNVDRPRSASKDDMSEADGRRWLVRADDLNECAGEPRRVAPLLAVHSLPRLLGGGGLLGVVVDR